MSTQELLTFLFNAIALGFIIIAAMDFGTRLVIAYKQVSIASNSPSTNTKQPNNQLHPTAKLQELPQLPDPWLLPVAENLPMNVPNPELEDLLRGVDLDKLKLRQARKVAKVLAIAQKVNGKDQKLNFLKSQIKIKLQQAESETVQVVKKELLAC